MKKAQSIFPIVMWLVLPTIILSSCSPEYRLHRLVALHPELVKNDTIHIQDTTFLPELRIDTVVHESSLRDTITITKEKLTVKIHQVRDTVYIEARQNPDTIIITKEIPVEKVIDEVSSKSNFFDIIKRKQYFVMVIVILLVVWILTVVWFRR